jgi:Xaa-Pro aminopeptidase
MAVRLHRLGRHLRRDPDFAGVWTDGRYYTQAEQELAGSEIQLMKIPSAASLLHIDWLAETLEAGQTVAVDARVLGLAVARLLGDALARAASSCAPTSTCSTNSGRSVRACRSDAIYEHEAPYAVATRADKLHATRNTMAKLGAERHFISTLDDIAYLFNLRGADVSYNPVFLAHALVESSSATLFVADGKIDAALRARLEQDGVRVAPYDQAAERAGRAGAGVLAAARPAPRHRRHARRRAAIGARGRSDQPDHLRQVAQARWRDGPRARHHGAGRRRPVRVLLLARTALADASRTPLTEVDIDTHITAARARRPAFVSPSFGTIAGFNANGAIMHYRATPEAHAVIEGDGLLLIDSGGQYLGGTTDITRVVPVGTPSAAHKRDFTLVLKGMINLSVARFPRGIKGPMLDALARAPIWAAGIDYGHGTGHGVGYFLNVHEGPQVISPVAMPEPHTAMEPGMITSNEPGIYRPATGASASRTWC